MDFMKLKGKLIIAKTSVEFEDKLNYFLEDLFNLPVSIQYTIDVEDKNFTALIVYDEENVK